MADVILKDREGVPVSYSVSGVKLYNAEGDLISFGAVSGQAKTVNLNMANGDQIILPDTGDLLNSVTVTKPTTLIPENIRNNIDIGGITGTYQGIIPTGTYTATKNKTSYNVSQYASVYTNIDTETPNVTLNFANTDTQIIEPANENNLLSKVTIQKPTELIKSNIRNGVTIAGIKGSLIVAPDWISPNNNWNWAYAYFNTSIPWSTILPTLSYDAQNLAALGILATSTSLEDVKGIVAAQYVQENFYTLIIIKSDQIIPIYSTQTGHIIFHGETDIEYDVSSGWNNISLIMPNNSAAIAFTSEIPGIDKTKIVAGDNVYFGDYMPKVHPSGILTITENGTYNLLDLLNYEQIVINISVEESAEIENNKTLVFHDNTSINKNTLILNANAEVHNNTITI